MQGGGVANLGRQSLLRLTRPTLEELIRMKRIPLRSRTALALGLCVPLTVALGAGPAMAAAHHAPAPGGRHLIPRHVYAPLL